VLDQRLTDFISSAKGKGVTDESVVALLRQQGWQEKTVYQALGAYYADTLGIPVPSRGTYTENARDAFLYLLLFITLGSWIFAMIMLGDALVDKFLNVDTYVDAFAFRQSVSGFLATIIIAFPIQLWVGWVIGKQARMRPESLESGVRKWLTYVALVVTAIVLLGDAIWFLSDFLRGELTTAFVLKTVVLVVLTGGVFLYYLAGIRRDELLQTRDRVFATAAIVIVIAGLVAGFIPLGSPAYGLSVKRDYDTVQAIYRIAEKVHSPVPAKLDAKPYKYERINANQYKICGTFETEYANAVESQWNHPAGDACFSFDTRNGTIPYPVSP
jgi:hypothetical protein